MAQPGTCWPDGCRLAGLPVPALLPVPCLALGRAVCRAAKRQCRGGGYSRELVAPARLGCSSSNAMLPTAPFVVGQQQSEHVALIPRAAASTSIHPQAVRPKHNPAHIAPGGSAHSASGAPHLPAWRRSRHRRAAPPLPASKHGVLRHHHPPLRPARSGRTNP